MFSKLNCFRTDSAIDPAEAKDATASPASPEKPKPMIFALMRNAHEVIRGSQKDIQAALDADDFDEAKNLYEKHKMWQELHARMEEGVDGGKTSPIGMFALLDKNFDDIATKEGLREEHKNLEEAEDALDKAFRGSFFTLVNYIDKAKDAFVSWYCLALFGVVWRCTRINQFYLKNKRSKIDNNIHTNHKSFFLITGQV